MKALVKMRCDFNFVASIMQKEYVFEVERDIKTNYSIVSGKNYSRISTITGIDRRFVKKILQHEQVFMPTNGVDKVAERLSELGEDNEVSMEELFEIIRSQASGRYTNTTVIDELLATNRIIINDNKVKFLSTNLKGNYSTLKYSQLLGESIDICHNTLWHLQNNNDVFHRWDFSRQIQPSDSKEANQALFNLAQKHKDEYAECLVSFETTDERIHPKIGMLQLHFDYNN